MSIMQTKYYGQIRMSIRLERDLPGVKAGAEWWYPCDGEWIIKLQESAAATILATAMLRAMSPEIISANSHWFAITGFEVFKEEDLKA